MGSHGLMPALSGVSKLLFSVDLYAGNYIVDMSVDFGNI
jgi:hypothetical protein